MRGGSFNNNRNNARCAYRNNNNPDNRNNNIGFRVCVSSTSLPSAGNAARLRLGCRGFFDGAGNTPAHSARRAEYKKAPRLGHFVPPRGNSYFKERHQFKPNFFATSPASKVGSPFETASIEWSSVFSISSCNSSPSSGSNTLFSNRQSS
ncbi:MAG: hypothetical protein IT315_02140 [Anaerolineales bacterium]|nr:hypothetical protein [Anaerolineales bacterium]